jgi:hypothetical protein
MSVANQTMASSAIGGDLAALQVSTDTLSEAT